MATIDTTAAARRTPLHARHRQAGGRLVPFAGWELPVQYAGIRQEHLAVRHDVGMFDVSHMGQIELRGPQAAELLQRLVSSDVRSLAGGGAQYGLICRDDGGVLDDVFTYRLTPRRFLTVTNAANHAKDLAWFEQHAAAYDVEVIDRAGDYAMIAVQGPRTANVVGELLGRALPARMRCDDRELAGARALVCRTGYTGEDGVELLTDPDDAPPIWDALLARGVTPCGLGARDTLRLEVCFHLYGNDMDESRNPIEAGLGWCCKEATGFIGADAVAAVRAVGPAEKLVPFVIHGSGIARQGNPVVGGGVVTSGSFSPSLDVGIGLAYVPTERAQPGSEFEIDVRGQRRTGVVATKPLYGGHGR
jgi:aminomethyltransferase